MISLLLVDDHDLVRAGIRRILEDDPNVRVLGEASTGEEAIEMVRDARPDMVILDVNMPGIGGLETLRKLIQIHPEVRVIVVTVHTDEPFPSRMLEAGALGYLTKSCAVEEITQAIESVMQGERYLCAEVAQQIALAKLNNGGRSPFEKLSQREIQVMLMVTQGRGIQEISDRLCLSPKTVNTYRYRLYEKLGVDNDIELMRLAVSHGVIEIESAGTRVRA